MECVNLENMHIVINKDKERTMAVNCVLIDAALNGNTDYINRMKRSGADVNAKGNGGMTALMWAALGGHTRCVDSLIQTEADANVRANDGMTALIYAAKGGHVACVDILVNSVSDLDVTDRYGKTALMYAATGGHSSCVDRLINAKANVDVKGDYGVTSLIYAAENGRVECLELLIRAGGNLKLRDMLHGMAAFMSAAKNGHIKCVDTLIRFGAEVNDTDHHRMTAIMYASENYHSECVSSLVRAGANVNVVNEKNQSPLICMASIGNVTCVQALIHSNADVGVQDDCGNTAIAVAVARSRLDCFEFLLGCLSDNEKTSNTMKDLLLRVSSLSNSHQWLPRLIQAGVFEWSWYPEFTGQGLQTLVRELVISGVAPGEFEFQGRSYGPLRHAFLIGDDRTVRYLMANLYVTSADLSRLHNDKETLDLQRVNRWDRSDGNDIDSLFHRLVSSPIRLETLCLLRISSLIATRRDRLYHHHHRRHYQQQQQQQQQQEQQQQHMDETELSRLLPPIFLRQLDVNKPIRLLCVNRWHGICGDDLALWGDVSSGIERKEKTGGEREEEEEERGEKEGNEEEKMQEDSFGENNTKIYRE